MSVCYELLSSVSWEGCHQGSSSKWFSCRSLHRCVFVRVRRENDRYVAPSGGGQETSETSKVVTAEDAVKGDICQTVWQNTNTQKIKERGCFHSLLWFLSGWDGCHVQQERRSPLSRATPASSEQSIKWAVTAPSPAAEKRMVQFYWKCRHSLHHRPRSCLLQCSCFLPSASAVLYFSAVVFSLLGLLLPFTPLTLCRHAAEGLLTCVSVERMVSDMENRTDVTKM